MTAAQPGDPHARPDTHHQQGDTVMPECDGLCVTAADIGVGYADQIAYPHPSCPLHDPDEVCECGHPDRCLSPTHDPAWPDPSIGARP